MEAVLIVSTVGLPISSGQRPEQLLNILKHTEEHSTFATKNYLVPNVIVLRLRNTDLRGKKKSVPKECDVETHKLQPPK